MWVQLLAEPLVSLEGEAEGIGKRSLLPAQEKALEHFIMSIPLNLPSRSSSRQAGPLWDVSAALRICQCRTNRACP